MEAATDKLDVIMDCFKFGVRYEAIAFDGEDLVLISAKAPLKPGEQVKPRGITVRQSVEWASLCAAADEDELPDGTGGALAEARWYALIAKHLEAYGAP